jgi:poly-beta-1,6-N-acetyl-D-glucosamine biosynthesis protein PgaD
MKSLIIDSPEQLNLRQKYAHNIFRLLLVLTWFYFLMPVLTLINWFFAYTFFEQNFILLEGYKEYQSPTTLTYLTVIAAMFIWILLWVNVNKFFDRKGEAKNHLTPVSITEMSSYFKVDSNKVDEYQKCKNMEVHFDQDGNITELKQR